MGLNPLHVGLQVSSAGGPTPPRVYRGSAVMVSQDSGFELKGVGSGGSRQVPALKGSGQEGS